VEEGPSRRARAGQLAREASRIRRVYASYDSDPSYGSRHRHDKEGPVSLWGTLIGDIGGVLHAEGYDTLAGKRILDVGCGYGDVLACMRRWGAGPENLVGIDLLPWRVDAARLKHPGLRFECQNAIGLEFDADSFDLVLCFTVMSSILDTLMATRVALEIDRVLRADGAILWYDLRYPNPFNPRVKAMRWKAIQRLFPEHQLRLRKVTLLPPLMRVLACNNASPDALPWKVQTLKGHYLGVIARRS
jgi:SAM-dependent methyltransferase